MGVEQSSLVRSREMDRVNDILTHFEKCAAKSDHNILIKDI
jgi:hypothetical protein